MPKCTIIAGPNGAGKTTFALEYLPSVAGCHHFINADLIAAGLNPLGAENELMAASRLFLKEIHEAIARQEDFAFETTLSGKRHLSLIQQLRSKNWDVNLIYLALPHVELSKQRVAERVAHGGHDIPVKDIVRRFPRSLKNLLGPYSDAAQHTRCFMNDGDLPVPVFEQAKGKVIIHHPEFYELLKKESQL